LRGRWDMSFLMRLESELRDVFQAFKTKLR
jgi:hypothetical protein